MKGAHFRGLFVGVDRYSSQDIAWLRFAERDAIALNAMFADTFGEGGKLLLGAEATRPRLEHEFELLGSVGPDDFVVVAFSGHGSSTHELVTYDADPLDLGDTAIPLDLLTEWFKAIPARRVVCVLDCCFSGAMGAKVLTLDSTPRLARSETAALEQLAGEGRLVLTASRANQPAWENPRIGHGLLTHFLLEALQGAEEVRDAGRVPVYRLLEFVTRRVTDAAGQFGARQEPTLRGTIDGELSWPIFTVGENYQQAFPELAPKLVTSQLSSLANRGFPKELIEAWSQAIPSLNPLQVDAINEFGLLDNSHVVVTAPTSSGKTMVGELAALQGVLEGRRALFLLPMRALVNDKHQEFETKYGPWGLRTIRATGEFSDDVPGLLRGQYDVCLMTYEKAAALIIANPRLLNEVGTIVIDEVQMIVDPGRGANLEFLLTLLRSRREDGFEPQLVSLSAVIGDANGLDRWIGARLLRRDERPVPLDEGIIRTDGSYRFLADDGEERIEPLIQPEYTGRGSSRVWLIPLARLLTGRGEQLIIFRESKSETQFVARYLAESLGLPSAEETIAALPTGDPSIASGDLRRALTGGVAFHNADLDRDERLAIEHHFRARNSTLRIIVATTTLAMGINTPAESVAVVGLTHPGPIPQPYTVAEYKNMIGRAGRLGFSARGRSFLLGPTPREEHVLWHSYILAQPEDLHSRFLQPGTDPRGLVLRVLATAAPLSAAKGMSKEAIVSFLEHSFGAFQQRTVHSEWSWDKTRLQHAVDELLRHGLLETDEKDNYHSTPLGQLAGESGTEVESVLRVVQVARTLSPDLIDELSLISLVQMTVELDDMYFPLNKRSTRKEPQAWIGELSQRGVPAQILNGFSRNVSDHHRPTLRAKKACACIYWIEGVRGEQIENTVKRFGGAFGAAGPISSVANRTIDLLATVSRIIELVHPGTDLSEVTSRLLLRLELGIPSPLVPVARETGLRLSRSDFLMLMEAGLASVPDLNGASKEELSSALRSGAKVAVMQQALKRIAERKLEGGD